MRRRAALDIEDAPLHSHTPHRAHLRIALLGWALLVLGYAAMVLEAWVLHTGTDSVGWTSMATAAAGLLAVIQSWKAWALRPSRW